MESGNYKYTNKTLISIIIDYYYNLQPMTTIYKRIKFQIQSRNLCLRSF